MASPADPARDPRAQTETQSRPQAGALRVAGLHSGYGRVTVLHGVAFDLAPGTVLGISGPNGAGKSTLLKTVAGVLTATAGKGFVWVKADCEGCEHLFFRGAGLRKLGTIVGEWHQRDGTPEAFAARLSKTHHVTWSEGIGGGPFRAVRR